MAGYAAGCVAVDVDHVPLIPMRHRIPKGTPRPAGHTLFLPAGIALAAGSTRGRAREALLGLAAGTCVHFLRDVATGTGLAPFQPLLGWRAKLPASVYGLAMALLAARAWFSSSPAKGATLSDGL